MLSIAVDLDAVLGDLVSPILDIINPQYGLNIQYSDVDEWEYTVKDMNISKEISKYLKNPQFVLNLPVWPGARKAVNNLFKQHHVTIATSRPKETENESFQWCAERFPFHKFQNFNGNSKKTLDSDILIDDYVRNIDDFVRFDDENRYAVLFQQPWNQKHDEIDDLIDKKRVVCCNNWDSIQIEVPKLKF
jgi:5'(3')-deoxyribonucleotidase